MKKQILVHDDEDIFVQRYARMLEKLDIPNFKVVPLCGSDFVREMQILIKRQRILRKGQTEYLEESEFDTAGVFVVDFDLVESDPKAEWTSEDAAYLVRCFSNCGLVIGLNLPTCSEFDLTLRGHLDSYADLNIVAKQLDNTRLWEGKTERDTFRPWYWPSLLSFLDRFEEKVRDVKEHFNDPICDVLGIQNVARLLPRSASQFLGGENPLTTTFGDFVTSSLGALRPKDRNLTTETMYRIAAARISKWLERRVLPGQDIVVDAPHLVMRYPSLLEGDHSKVETWDRTAAFNDFSRLGVKYSTIEEFRFKNSHWISRPVWFWRNLAESENIKEVVAPWEKETSRYVFCEDASVFYDRELCREFDAEVDSPYVRRYVRYFDGIDYQPLVRTL
jgi:hypothetical protein